MLFQYEPELDAFLEFLIWRFSIWVDKPTPGNALMNLRYRDEHAVEARGKGQQFMMCYLCYQLTYDYTKPSCYNMWNLILVFYKFQNYAPVKCVDIVTQLSK